MPQITKLELADYISLLNAEIIRKDKLDTDVPAYFKKEALEKIEKLRRRSKEGKYSCGKCDQDPNAEEIIPFHFRTCNQRR